MECLKCGNQMENGFLNSSSEIAWVSNQYFNSIKKVNEPSNIEDFFNPSSQLQAFRCLPCNRIELTFDQKIKRYMVSCQSCGSSTSEANKFCSNCGKEITAASESSAFLCFKCKETVTSDDIICPSCGSDLDQFASDILNTCVECGYSDKSLEDMVECPKCGALLPI